MEHIIKTYKEWRYKNTTLLFISFIALFLLAKTTLVSDFTSAISSFGYLGAIVTGVFFVSTFTVAPAGLVIFKLAAVLNPLGIALAAGLGALIGDFLIFRFFKDHVFEELRPFFRRLGTHSLMRIFSTPYFAWILPVLGAFIIASPFPDEIGIGLMGISRMKTWQFLLLAFVLNSTGIFFIVTLANSFS